MSQELRTLETKGRGLLTGGSRRASRRLGKFRRREERAFAENTAETGRYRRQWQAERRLDKLNAENAGGASRYDVAQTYLRSRQFRAF